MDVNNAISQGKKKQTKIDIGATLVEARKKQKLSAQDIASQLNLTLAVVNSIENNQFEQSIPITFIRGYLRSYARKVGADVETLSVEFDRQIKTEEQPLQKIQVVSNFSVARKEFNSNHFIFKLVTFIILLSLFAFAGWKFYKRIDLGGRETTQAINAIELDGEEQSQFSDDEEMQEDESTDYESSLESSFEAEDEEQEQNQQQDQDLELRQNPRQAVNIQSDDWANEQSLINSNQDEQLTKASASENQSISSNDTLDSVQIREQLPQSDSLAMEAPKVTAEFTFADDCWVKVTDALGEVLAIGIKSDGKVMPIEGVSPLTVILGNPGAVTLQLNGEPYDLSNYPAGRSATFTLE